MGHGPWVCWIIQDNGIVLPFFVHRVLHFQTIVTLKIVTFFSVLPNYKLKFYFSILGNIISKMVSSQNIQFDCRKKTYSNDNNGTRVKYARLLRLCYIIQTIGKFDRIVA